jgi:hypothetical protein
MSRGICCGSRLRCPMRSSSLLSSSGNSARSCSRYVCSDAPPPDSCDKASDSCDKDSDSCDKPENRMPSSPFDDNSQSGDQDQKPQPLTKYDVLILIALCLKAISVFSYLLILVSLINPESLTKLSCDPGITGEKAPEGPGSNCPGRTYFRTPVTTYTGSLVHSWP